MHAIQEFLPLIFVVVFVIISVRNGMNKQRKEELEKTTLPGRKSTPVFQALEVDTESSIPAEPEKPRKAKIASKIPHTSLQSARPNGRENLEDADDPILNTDDPDELKKAIIYTEIFNRKNY
jgi:hypothetical protein